MSAHTLDEAYQKYLRTWGPLRWAELVAEPTTQYSESRIQTVRALGAIEADSRTMYQKIRVAGVDRDQIIADFAVRWLAEETEHGRALDAIANLYGTTQILRPRARKPTLRQRAAWPVLAAARPLHAYMTPAYCALGAAQEYIALTTYDYLSRELPDRGGGALLRAMSVQEARHMRFYLAAARSKLRTPSTQRFVRRVLAQLWKPVGFDAIGATAWWAAFDPLIADEAFRTRLLQLDRVVGTLPGLGSLELMASFFADSGR